jgi:DNA-binding beta-propeller fold protein YncE
LSNNSNAAGFEWITGIAVSSDGKTIYVADSDDDVIRKIAIASDGTTSIATVAGGNGYGYLDGAGSIAEFRYPEELAMDGSGNLYVTDEDNHAIRKIVVAADGTSTVSTVAGGPDLFGHQDGPAASALLGYTAGLAVSSDGTAIYFFDEYSNLDDSYIREIAIDGKGNATVSTIAGGNEGYQDSANGPAEFSDWCPALALSSDGTTLYVADEDNYVVRTVLLTPTPATVSTLAGTGDEWGHQDGLGNVALFQNPTGLVLDNSGNLFVTDAGYEDDCCVAPVTSTTKHSANRPVSDRRGPSEGEDSLGTMRKIVLSTTQVSTVILNVFGNTGGNADGAGATAGFEFPGAVVSDPSGNLYVSDTINSTIRKIAFASDGSATVSTVAGTAGVYGWADGTGSAAQFFNPLNLAIDPAGANLYVNDSGNEVLRQIDLATGAVTTLLDLPESVGIAADDSGNLYNAWGDVVLISNVTSETTHELDVTDPSGNPYEFWDAYSLALYTSSDKSQNFLYVGEDCDVVKVDLATLYATPLAGTHDICGYQDGTGTAALFDGIESIAVDSQGNVYAADLANNVVRRITQAGVVTTVVGTYGNTTAALGLLPATIIMPYGVALNPSDNLIVTVPNAVLYLQP